MSLYGFIGCRCTVIFLLTDHLILILEIESQRTDHAENIKRLANYYWAITDHTCTDRNRGVSRGGVIGVRWPPHKNFSWPPQSEVWTKFQKMFACGAFIGWLDTPLGWCGGGGGVGCKLTTSQLTQPPHKLSNLARPFIIKSYILTLWGRRRESVF